jgi:NADH-quinone oxidoreductase subunit J
MIAMEQVAFFAGAIGALGGAVAVIALRNPFYSVLALVVHLFSLAGLFLILHAEFVAAAQVVVYAGAVMVLYVFVAAYVGGFEEPLWDAIPGQRLLAPLLAGALFIELSIAVLGTALKSLETEGPTIELGFGSPEAIGRLFLERFLVPFEAASMLLLIAAVGAVILAARRPPLHPSTNDGDPLAIEPARFAPLPAEGGTGGAPTDAPPEPAKPASGGASPVTPGGSSGAAGGRA